MVNAADSNELMKYFAEWVREREHTLQLTYRIVVFLCSLFIFHYPALIQLVIYARPRTIVESMPESRRLPHQGCESHSANPSSHMNNKLDFMHSFMKIVLIPICE